MIIPLSTDVLLTVIVYDNLLLFVSFLTLYKFINLTAHQCYTVIFKVTLNYIHDNYYYRPFQLFNATCRNT